MIDFSENIHPQAKMLPLERKALYDSVGFVILRYNP